jgi:kinesin family protein C1
MIGGLDAASKKGIIPRSLEQIFKSSQTLASQGWAFKMQVELVNPCMQEEGLC